MSVPSGSDKSLSASLSRGLRIPYLSLGQYDRAEKVSLRVRAGTGGGWAGRQVSDTSIFTLGQSLVHPIVPIFSFSHTMARRLQSKTQVASLSHGGAERGRRKVLGDGLFSKEWAPGCIISFSF